MARAWVESKHPRDGRGRFTTVTKNVKKTVRKGGKIINKSANKIGGGAKSVGRGVKHVGAGFAERHKAGKQGLKAYDESFVGTADSVIANIYRHDPNTQAQYRQRRAKVYNTAAKGAFSRGMERSMKASKRKKAAQKAAKTRRNRKAASQSGYTRRPGNQKG